MSGRLCPMVQYRKKRSVDTLQPTLPEWTHQARVHKPSNIAESVLDKQSRQPRNNDLPPHDSDKNSPVLQVRSALGGGFLGELRGAFIKMTLAAMRMKIHRK